MVIVRRLIKLVYGGCMAAGDACWARFANFRRRIFARVVGKVLKGEIFPTLSDESFVLRWCSFMEVGSIQIL